LPEPVISEKLDRLEEIAGKIFSYVKQHPKKLPDIRKFMCYYMPITLKLVTAYQEFEQSEEMEATRAEIRDTLDTINQAFSNLLQNLYQHDDILRQTHQNHYLQ
ncbi:MAG: 5-bromo-4-chloroindolyl phosphate hydrolysis family protein, partial [Bacteroidaceae bacterium]